MYKSLTQKIFVELLERVDDVSDAYQEIEAEGIITSLDEFISLVVEACSIYYKTFSVPDRNKILIVDDFPRDLFTRINKGEYDLSISDTSLRDIRVVTYAADELPASISAHAPDKHGIRNIKPRYFGSYDDPEYTGYSIARLGKDIEATVDFLVWGIDAHDIRARSKLLRNILQTNTWYFKQKGLREIIWMGSVEAEMWDKQNIVKMKKEKYLVKYTEIQETREKNIEQVIVQAGLN